MGWVDAKKARWFEKAIPACMHRLPPCTGRRGFHAQFVFRRIEKAGGKKVGRKRGRTFQNDGEEMRCGL